MLHRFIQEFLAYCHLASFSHRSLQALAIRLSPTSSIPIKYVKIKNLQKSPQLRRQAQMTV
jgi:hypothetical protein